MMFICQRTGFIRQQTGFICQQTGFICQWTGLIHVHNELASKASPLVNLVSSLTDEASPLTNVPVNCVLSILKQLWAKSPKFRSTRYLKIPTLFMKWTDKAWINEEKKTVKMVKTGQQWSTTVNTTTKNCKKLFKMVKKVTNSQKWSIMVQKRSTTVNTVKNGQRQFF